jgi:hypothetical protein
MRWRTIDARVRLLGILLALATGYDVYVLPAIFAPATPVELAGLAEAAWWALCFLTAFAVLRCAAGAGATGRRALAPQPAFSPPLHPVVGRRRD